MPGLLDPTGFDASHLKRPESPSPRRAERELPHRRHRARDRNERLNVPRGLGVRLEVARDGSLEPPPAAGPERCELRRLRPAPPPSAPSRGGRARGSRRCPASSTRYPLSTSSMTVADCTIAPRTRIAPGRPVAGDGAKPASDPRRHSWLLSPSSSCPNTAVYCAECVHATTTSAPMREPMAPGHRIARVPRIPRPVHERGRSEPRHRHCVPRGECLETLPELASELRRPDRGVRNSMGKLGQVRPMTTRLDRVPRDEAGEPATERRLHPVRLRLHRVELTDPHPVPDLVDRVTPATRPTRHSPPTSTSSARCSGR